MPLQFHTIKNLKKFRLLILSIIFASLPAPIFSEWYYGLTFGRNEGKQILETGSKTPDLNGFAGGSRLTYPRNFNYFGIKGRYNSESWTSNLSFTTTGWYKRTGTAINEDFFLNEQSSIKDSGSNYNKWRFRDTPYAITGSRNFAEAKGKTNMSSYDTQIDFLFFPFLYFANSKSTDKYGFFIDGALKYSYFKYYVYDVVQYVNLRRLFFLGPIGYGNSFSNSLIEYPFGIGYKIEFEKFDLLVGLQYNNGYSTGKDFHKQRNLNFILKDLYGTGYNYRLELEFPLENNKTIIQTKFYGHHYYSKGVMTTKGGLGLETVLLTMVTRQGVRLSTKETGFETSILQKF